jgi:hypothetical protein
MAKKSYTLQKSKTFTDGYWLLDLSITAASGVDARPFLMEKFLAPGETITGGTEDPRFIRCLLGGEPTEYPNESDETSKYTVTSSAVTAEDVRSRDFKYYRWAKYKTNTFSRKFFSHEALVSALSSITAILKSNVAEYVVEPPTPPPRLVAINLSSADKIPQAEQLDAYQGDVISLQVTGGIHGPTVVTDPGLTLNVESNLAMRVSKTTAVLVKLMDATHTFIGLQDATTNIQYIVQLDMLEAVEQTNIVEVIGHG